MVVVEIPVFAVSVSAVVVANLAVVAVPITCIIAPAIMTRFHPARSVVSRARPVSVVPLVVIPHWIPVS